MPCLESWTVRPDLISLLIAQEARALCFKITFAWFGSGGVIESAGEVTLLLESFFIGDSVGVGRTHFFERFSRMTAYRTAIVSACSAAVTLHSSRSWQLCLGDTRCYLIACLDWSVAVRTCQLCLTRRALTIHSFLAFLFFHSAHRG